ncbi:MAG: 16S rRNA (guanine(527)-N(7))-methyltransferase RsmG [Chloroflexi bacterium]|nr:16S rRNA (guanine(527)-N(7))-methyltransferase RsmG [Chloroflexota bacterium]
MAESLYPTLVQTLPRLGIQFSTSQWETLDGFVRLLLERNAQVNLTGADSREELEVRHLLDSFTVAPLLPDDGSVIDIGSGGGLPALPLAIFRPSLSFTLVEATGKKAQFIAATAQALGLPNVRVVNQRAEILGQSWEYRQRFDLVLARAIASLPVLAELMLPFARLLGTAVAMKKGAVDEEIAAARKAISVCGGELQAVQSIAVSELLPDHQLIVLEKVGATPSRYPRRPGIPQRQPIH